MMRAVVAPDSFKGSIGAAAAAEALEAGWHTLRPDDTVTRVPLADGGEGTLADDHWVHELHGHVARIRPRGRRPP